MLIDIFNYVNSRTGIDDRDIFLREVNKADLTSEASGRDRANLTPLFRPRTPHGPHDQGSAG